MQPRRKSKQRMPLGPLVSSKSGFAVSHLPNPETQNPNILCQVTPSTAQTLPRRNYNRELYLVGWINFSLSRL